MLLIDNDKQGNLSKAYSRYDAENVAPVTRLLVGDWENADELIQHTEYEGIDIVTANMSLFGATWNLTKEEQRKPDREIQSAGNSESAGVRVCKI